MTAPDDSPLRLAVMGPGEIAAVFAAAALDVGAAQVTRVLGRRRERAEAFAERFGGRVVDDFSALVKGEGADAPEALYVATPHPLHGVATGGALMFGLAVLCEKPLTLDATEAQVLVESARSRGTALMEGWMYRLHPQIAALFDVVASGALGTVERVVSEFAYSAPVDPAHRLFDPALGGGAIRDVGGYPLSFALGVARAVAGGDAEVLETARLTAAAAEMTATGVDGDARATLAVGGIEAELRTAITRDGGMRARVVGTRGEAWLEQPFLPEGQRRGRVGVLHVVSDGTAERVALPSVQDCFALEALELRRLARTPGVVGPSWPLVDHAETIAIARLAGDWHARALAGPDPADLR